MAARTVIIFTPAVARASSFLVSTTCRPARVPDSLAYSLGGGLWLSVGYRAAVACPQAFPKLDGDEAYV
jgi:hypothetical protein